MRLVIFDVDGTLTRSTTVDAACYARAVSEHLGLRIDTDWSSYRHATDAGILRELLQRCGIAENPSNIAAVKHRFVGLLSAALATDPTCCREVPGARSLIESLRKVPNLQLAIATGAWADSARLKLRHANLTVDQLPFASRDPWYRGSTGGRRDRRSLRCCRLRLGRAVGCGGGAPVGLSFHRHRV